MSEPIAEGWITTGEAAALIGYHVKYVRRLARQGRMQARKVGRDWRINLRSLLAYKAEMDRLGTEKHNPWRDDLHDRGRDRKESRKESRT